MNWRCKRAADMSRRRTRPQEEEVGRTDDAGRYGITNGNFLYGYVNCKN